MFQKLVNNTYGLLAADWWTDLGEEWSWVGTIINALKTPLLIILVLLAAAGTVYSVVLGVNMAKADSVEKREEAKARMVNVIVAFAITVALIALFYLVIYVIIPAVNPTGGYEE